MRFPSAKSVLIAWGMLINSSLAADSIVVDGTSFALNGENMSYRFHVDNATGDLITDHYGAPIDGVGIMAEPGPIQGWVNMIGRVRREFPDHGRGDFRLPAFKIVQSEGYTRSEFVYQSHDVMPGKLGLPGLPSTFGEDDEVSTLVVHMHDNYSSVAADLTYSVFPKHDAVVRSVKITNQGEGNITINKLASFNVDLAYEDYEMIELRGDWSREAQRQQRKVEYGIQGFESRNGYSSHLHNPFVSIVKPGTTETTGEAWGFSLVYTGSFAVNVEKSSQGFTRAQIGMSPDQLSWNLGPGESLTSPEAVSVFSSTGVGGMSRRYHRLFRKNLMLSQYANQTRPTLFNTFEGLGFDFNESSLYRRAQEAAELGVKLFVVDDGWFGDEYPRVSDDAGLGDWVANPDRFPNGLKPLVDNVTALEVANTTSKMRFGLWFEPEMVNPNSTLYHEHPEWALHAGDYPRTLTRNQLVLNVALVEVQDFIIESVSKFLNSSSITEVKWDNNRGIDETPSPMTDYKYMLGLYRVFQELTTRFPDVLWEGCASGGGRFDPGMLQYFPQIWTSDDTDAVERIPIQFGTSLVYPPAAMGAHVGGVPNRSTGRNVSLAYRAHVAMMGGSFGLQFNPDELSDTDREQIPGLLALAEKVNPIVINGDFWRLNLPENNQYPAAMFISEDGAQAVVFYFSLTATIDNSWPQLRLQGLDPGASYTLDGNQTFTGATLMNYGVGYRFKGDYDSKVILLEKQ